MKDKKKVVCILVIIVLIIIMLVSIIFQVHNENAIEYVSYNTFLDKVGKNDVNRVKITSNKLYFDSVLSKKNDYTLKTDNPNSQELKEFLLKNNIKVEEPSSSLIILDVLFYGIFFGAVRIWYL